MPPIAGKGYSSSKCWKLLRNEEPLEEKRWEAFSKYTHGDFRVAEAVLEAHGIKSKFVEVQGRFYRRLMLVFAVPDIQVLFDIKEGEAVPASFYESWERRRKGKGNPSGNTGPPQGEEFTVVL
jgi:hypothetical protein